MGFIWIIFNLFACYGLADREHFHDYPEYAKLGDAPAQRYKSSDVVSPIFNVGIWNESAIDTESPHIFFSTADGNSGGPYIFSSKDLSLVYADRHYNASNNARVQRYQNETLFTFWEGDQGKGHAQGTCRMFNNKYELVRSVASQNTTGGTDLHECEITKEGTVLITVYESRSFDLLPVGGFKNDRLLDSVFEEIDIATGRLLFQWRGSDYIPIDESYAGYASKTEGGWDAYHINSLQKDHEGNYYVSLRHLHALLKISGKDGSRIWQLGGKMNNFTDLSDGHATDFAWQHHTRFVDSNFTELTVFDNRNLHGEREIHCVGRDCSRGARIELDYLDMTARLLQNFYSPTGLLSYAMGGYDTTPNGNVLIGWGQHPEITEFTPDGMPVMNIHFGKLGSWVRTYRVYKGRWEAYPPWPPSVAAQSDGQSVRLYASWNGATEVAAWVVGGSQYMEHLRDLDDATPISRTERKGFETEIEYNSGERYVRIVAVTKDDMVLGATWIVDALNGEIFEAPKPPSDLYFSPFDGIGERMARRSRLSRRIGD